MTNEKIKLIKETDRKIAEAFDRSNPLYIEKQAEYRKKLDVFKGTFVECDEGCVLVKKGTKTVRGYVTKQTIRDSDLTLKKGSTISVVLFPFEGQNDGVFLYILKEEEASMLGEEEDIWEQIKNVKGYFDLSKEKMDIISAIRNGIHYPSYNFEQDIHVNPEEYKMFYKLTKESYPTQTQALIEQIFKLSSTFKPQDRTTLNYIFNIFPTNLKRKEIDPDEFKKELSKEFYHLESQIKMVCDTLVSNQKAKKRGCNILLIGSPGVGKTAFAEAIARKSNLPCETIGLNSIDNKLDLIGTDKNFAGSTPGLFADIFLRNHTSEMVIILDELACAFTESREGNAMDVIKLILSGVYHDKNLECDFSCENTIFIATANSLDSVPEDVINRFNIKVPMEEYSLEEKLVIGRDYILPRLRNNFHISENDLVIPDYTISCILNEYCEDAGARDLGHNLESIIRTCIGEGKGMGFRVEVDYARKILDPVVNRESYGIIYNRNKLYYSEKIATEIRKYISLSKNRKGRDSSSLSPQLIEMKLEYLLSCKNVPVKNEIDPKTFKMIVTQNHFGMDHVADEIAAFYYLQKHCKNTRMNLALYGGPGTGKSSICKSIAEAMNLPYERISLNGISKIEELVGHSSTYVNSTPGLIMRAVKSADSLTLVLQLDEIDKLSRELSYVLISLLDREFTDNCLEVPVNLENAVFIATANNWENVDPIIRDRFVSIEVPGYSKADKSHILEEFIIPKMEQTYTAKGKLNINMEEDAKQLLLDDYCQSFGVRDVEKSVERIVGRKITEYYEKNGKETKTIRVSKRDVTRILGKPMVSTGNFPSGGAIPGVVKALAVGGNRGKTFAIETVLLPIENGREESLHITGLPKESTIDSCKIAFTYLKLHYPDLMRGNDVFIHFAEGAVPKDGPSAGVAIALSILSAAKGVPVMIDKPADCAFTGEIDLMGGVYKIGGTREKIQAANASGCKKVFIPRENYEELGAESFREFQCKVVPISHLSEVIDQLFGNDNSNNDLL